MGQGEHTVQPGTGATPFEQGLHCPGPLSNLAVPRLQGRQDLDAEFQDDPPGHELLSSIIEALPLRFPPVSD